MGTQRLTVELSEPVFRSLAQIAELTQQSPEQLAAQSITGNLPPSVENAPPEMHAELLAMQKLSLNELLKIAHSQVQPAQRKRHLALLEKSHDGSITPEQRQELSDLRLAADRLMLRKAYAWAVLRWRGYPVPTLAQLPLE